MLDFQIEIEKLLHKNQLIPRIKTEFKTAPLDFNRFFLDHKINPDFGFDLLTQMSLHKRTKLEVLVGILRRHFDGNCQATADALLTCIHHQLVSYDENLRVFIVNFDITPGVQAELDRYQYPLPMVVEPKEVQTNQDVGYYTSKGSIILKDNHHDGDVCLDHINRMNRVKMRLNQDVATTIKNQWRGLDKPKEDDKPGEYEKRVKAFEKYDRVAHDVHLHLGLANEGEFWLTHKVDFRGRTYCQGHHVSYQATAWNKAIIELANKEITEG